MDGFVRTRRLIRRSKKVWVAGLCAASFACGHCLFGDEPAESDSLLSQYLKTTKQVVAEVPAPTARRQSAAASSPPAPSPSPSARRPEPEVDTTGVQQTDKSPIANDSPEQQIRRQTSSRRVKPPEGAPPTSYTTKPPVAATPTPKIEEATPAVAATQPAEVTATPLEVKPQPSVTYVDVPLHGNQTQNPAVSRMEIVTAPSQSQQTTSPISPNKSPSPTQPQIIENTPFVSSRSPIAGTNTTPAPQPQGWNISRAVPAPPVPSQPKVLRTVSAVDEANLPPIVSPDSVPRPGMRKKMQQQAAAATIQATAPTPVLRIELGTKQPPAQ
jgi:hypothetical protein